MNAPPRCETEGMDVLAPTIPPERLDVQPARRPGWPGATAAEAGGGALDGHAGFLRLATAARDHGPCASPRGSGGPASPSPPGSAPRRRRRRPCLRAGGRGRARRVARHVQPGRRGGARGRGGRRRARPRRPPDESAQAAADGDVRFRRRDRDPVTEPEVSREERVLDAALDLGVMRKTHGDLERHIFPARNLHIGWGREESARSSTALSRARGGSRGAGESDPPGLGPRRTRRSTRGRPRQPTGHWASRPASAHRRTRCFVEEGFRVEAFWAARSRQPSGYFMRGHFHPPDLSTGFEAQHLGNRIRAARLPHPLVDRHRSACGGSATG